MATQEKIKYDTHWHLIVSNIASALQISGYGATLEQAIRKRKLEGKPLWISLWCAGCGGFLAAADKLAMNHLEQRPTTPSIPCPKCGSDGGHTYQGLRT